MTIVELNGHPTWVTVGRTRGEDVVLLHGGLSSSASLRRSVGRRLSATYRVSAFDRRGHGRTADTDEPFHYESMATETIAFLEWLGRPAHLIGHSDGAIVGLLVAMSRPDLVGRVVAVGANTHPEALEPMEPFPTVGPVFDEWATDYASKSPDGYAHARVVIEKTMHLFRTEPRLRASQLATVSVATLIMVGDDDSTRLEDTIAIFRAIPESQLAVVPGASHALLKEYPRETTALIQRFLRGPVPPETIAPIRRQPTSR